MSVIIAGAGLSGLACALALADAGMDVELHEAAPQAGGRCRSWFDEGLGAEIDNGTHLIAGGNKAAWAYLHRLDAETSMQVLPPALPMMDLADGRRWLASPLSLLPTVAAAFPRLMCGQDATVAQALGRSRHYGGFWHPLALAALNTDPEQAQALLLRRVLARTVWRGAASSRLYRAKESLSASFITPAVEELRRLGVTLRFGHPLRRVVQNGGKARELVFDDESRHLSRHDRLVLALPAPAARRLLPDLPDLPHSAIANVHFRLTVAQADQSSAPLGLIGGLAQWLFVRDNILSITLSAAPNLTEQSVETLWEEACKALGIKGDIPECRHIQEKLATLLHSPATERLRRAPTVAENILLCGDVTTTGLPCTIEGAVLSGRRAAILAAAR
ncbi:MAG TPA: FAD-dependent oxidoreductase [Candidatus Sulfotelmatobacter sp.]|jgi:phytoene dehydrogenase-like protein|nr:FAD-dependent oxidoreductase [Candidatus Sulfotelmatobacter sp.]